MARSKSFDGSFDDLPLSIQRAALVNRDFHRDAVCRNDVRGTPKIAWIADPKRKYKVGANLYQGTKLVELALVACATCPVQWRSAAAAIEADEAAGVWSDTLQNLRWLSKHPNHLEALEMAQSAGVPVQRLIVQMREMTA